MNMTRLLVLGLLDSCPRSGYDIQRALEELDTERWGGVLIGSIYHALKKLEQEQYIELAEIAQTGHRQKAVYRITPQGSAYLKELVAEALKQSSTVYPQELYSALSFIDKLPPAAAYQALLQQQQALEAEYQALEQGFKDKAAASAEDLPPLVRLSFGNMFAIVRQQQYFIGRLLETLPQDE